MQPRAQLTITLTATGQIQVSGPIADKGVCYMLLELARDAIRDFKPPVIQAPTPPQSNLLGTRLD